MKVRHRVLGRGDSGKTEHGSQHFSQSDHILSEDESKKVNRLSHDFVAMPPFLANFWHSTIATVELPLYIVCSALPVSIYRKKCIPKKAVNQAAQSLSGS